MKAQKVHKVFSLVFFQPHLSLDSGMTTNGNGEESSKGKFYESESTETRCKKHYTLI